MTIGHLAVHGNAKLSEKDHDNKLASLLRGDPSEGFPFHLDACFPSAEESAPVEMKEKRAALLQESKLLLAEYKDFVQVRAQLRQAALERGDLDSIEKLRRMPLQLLDLFGREVALRASVGEWLLGHRSHLLEKHAALRNTAKKTEQDVRRVLSEGGFDRTTFAARSGAEEGQFNMEEVIASHRDVKAAKQAADGFRVGWIHELDSRHEYSSARENEERLVLVKELRDLLIQRAVSSADWL